MFPLSNLFHLSFSMCRFSTWMFDQIYRAVLISLVIYVRYTRGAFRFYFLDLPHSLFKLASCLEEISKSSAFDRFPFFFLIVSFTFSHRTFYYFIYILNAIKYSLFEYSSRGHLFSLLSGSHLIPFFLFFSRRSVVCLKCSSRIRAG